jgi:hypothetical protein
MNQSASPFSKVRCKHLPLESRRSKPVDSGSCRWINARSDSIGPTSSSTSAQNTASGSFVRQSLDFLDVIDFTNDDFSAQANLFASL